MLMKSVERLAKWRAVFAAWQLGTRSDQDQECKAVKDHREATILLRAEVNVLTRLLLEKGVFNEQEFTGALEEEAEMLSADYEKRFPGISATDSGMSYDLEAIRKHGTMEGWPP